jgi:hypothetical protein
MLSQKFRDTGRTSRIIEKAKEMVLNGDSVAVVMMHSANSLDRFFDEDIIKTGRIKIINWCNENINWKTLSLYGLDNKYKLLFDHCVLEEKFPNITDSPIRNIMDLYTIAALELNN